MRLLTPALVLLALVPVGRSEAQLTAYATDPASPNASVPSSVARATLLRTGPTLDGFVHDDPAWRDVPAITEFWQTRPNEGSVATERTEVRVSFDGVALYVGIVCYDREPTSIVVSDRRRDASLENADSFSFILDTYKDGQNGFVFGTNPAGIQYDAQVTREGRGGSGGNRQQSGSGGGFNINWDGVWDVYAAVGDFGWSAEFVIPFKTLRYPKGVQQTWGVNFQRNIGRKNETAYWIKLSRQNNLNRVSLAGALEGIEVPAVRNLLVMPYALTVSKRDFTAVAPSTDNNFDAGIDAKYSITPSMTLDATVNTDFAQVEVDEQQINLDRFRLFFPEKRPFFLENAGLFSVGEPGEVELFFSRRIGIGADGVEVPILAGGRLSGTVSNTRIGFLTMQTDRVSTDSIAGNNFGVVRIQRELRNRSAAGFLVTNRQGVGRFSEGDDHNRLFSFDGRLGLGEYGLLSGFVARSATPDADGGQHAVNFSAQYDSPAFRLSAGYTELGTAFGPEVGFLSREAYRKFAGSVFHRYRVPNNWLGFHELRPHANYRAFWGVSDGFQETGYLHLDNHWEWTSGYQIHTGVNFTREGVRESFEIADDVSVPVGTFDHREIQLVANTSPSKWWQLNGRVTAGGFFGGDRVSSSYGVRVRAGETFSSSVSANRNDVSLPGGDFVTNLVRARLSYSFTPRIYLQSLIQFNDSSDELSVNLRFGWLRTANTGLFVVFNQLSAADGVFIENPMDRGMTIKYTHFFDVLR